ncbi:hypothetical protein GIS00_09615 [Nakamurella sp. YIM 132087]|uniref:Branched-chain amino acid ABC transporter permease n=1 Tax=Nakamurella alba TaxID=2665158 RepID=A0A7K1FJA0_9ACTN|nr:branched-chain amino acid ABC transporter permease [Nakamurella alba]MTD14202.1 hypothetical protein [Nakamurella alba]
MLNAITSGILVGGLFALVALSLSLTFLATRTGNFGTGELVSAGAGVAVLSAAVGPGWLRFLLALLVGGLLGALISRLLITPFHVNARDYRWLLSTLGLGMILIDLQTNGMGVEPLSLAVFKIDGFYRLGDLGLAYQALVILALAVLLSVGISCVLRWTALGRVIRASAEDPETALLMGISVKRLSMFVYAGASMIAVLAGLMYGAQTTVTPSLGPPLLVGAISVAVIGGINSIPGVLIGGLAYGLINQLGTYFFDAVVGSTAGLIAVVLVLMLKPEGILGTVPKEKV